MEPDFKEGDMLIVDASIAPKPGSYVIAQNGSHEATFKNTVFYLKMNMVGIYLN